VRRARACDDILLLLEAAGRETNHWKKARVQKSSSDAFVEADPAALKRPYTAEQMQWVRDMERMVRKLVTEGHIAQRMQERKEAVGGDTAVLAVLQSRLSALLVMQRKSLAQREAQLGATEEAEVALRSIFGTGVTSGVIRPFLSAERLREVSDPYSTQYRLLQPGDVLHVPVSQEECQVLLKHLGAEPFSDFDHRLLDACHELPGRTLADLRRFLEQLPECVKRHHTDVRLLRKVVLFEDAMVRSAEGERTRTVFNLLQERSTFGLSGQAFVKKAARQLLAETTMHDIGSSAHYCRMIGNPTDVKFSPLGARKRWLIAGSSPSKPYELMLFDLDARLGEPNLTRLYAHEGGVVTEIQWAGDGSFVATSGFDSFVRIWDPMSGNQLASMKQRHAVHGLVASRRQEAVLASRAFENMGNSTELRVWNTQSNTSVDLGEDYAFLGHVEQASFLGAADEHLVAVTDGSHSSSFGEAIVWNWESGRQEPIIVVKPHDGGITCVDASRGANSIFCTGGTDLRVALVDARLPKPTVCHMFVPKTDRPMRTEFQGVSFSPCSTLIAAASNRNNIVVFDVRAAPVPLCQLNHKYTQSGFSELPATDENELQGAYRTVWAPFGKVLISGGEDGCLRIWDMSRSESEKNIKTIRAHSQCVSALDVSPCGTAIASGADDLRVGLYTTSQSTMQLGQRRRDGANPNPNAAPIAVLQQ
jgi:WD40 repeat protein